MAYGEPQGPSGHQYSLTFNSTTLVDGYPVTFNVTVSTENVGDPGVPAIVQSFADAVHVSPDFALMSAARTTQYTENLTPSPEE